MTTEQTTNDERSATYFNFFKLLNDKRWSVVCRLRSYYSFPYTVFVLNLCLRTNINSVIIISNKLTAVERIVFTIKYQALPNCQASSKKSHAWCNILSIPAKIRYGQNPPMLLKEGSSKLLSAPSCGIKIFTRKGLT